MSIIRREIQSNLSKLLRTGKSVLLLGPRQTGKSTVLRQLESDLFINLAETGKRQLYEAHPDRILSEVRGLETNGTPVVIIDEIQKVPDLLDNLQVLIDEKAAQFVLTGSSARKLKRDAHVNLLPGRLLLLKMDPLSIDEIAAPNLDRILSLGLLPEIYLSPDSLAKDLLHSYVEIYLEEEIRKEAIVKNLGPFGRFVELAALSSGQITNYSSISNEIGLSAATVRNYFEILEQTLVAHRVEPLFTSATRKKLTRSNRFLFFDLGVRRSAAREASRYIPARKGQIFEEFVGLELIKLCHLINPKARLRFWRDPDGPEVDWVLENQGHYLPIEVKYKVTPEASDARHLKIFTEEYKNSEPGIIVCTTERKLKLSDTTVAWPWQRLRQAVESFLRQT